MQAGQLDGTDGCRQYPESAMDDKRASLCRFSMSRGNDGAVTAFRDTQWAPFPPLTVPQGSSLTSVTATRDAPGY